MEKTIEIPFGAKDSELKGWEYTIPENMEAEIKDGKVIVKQKKSEDERIRKLLVWQVYRNIEDETNDLAQSVYDGIKGHDPDLEESIEDWKRCLVYLEKQKEPIPIPDKFSGLKSLMLQYLQSAANRKDDTEIESDTNLWGRKILDYVWKYGGLQKEQKPLPGFDELTPDEKMNHPLYLEGFDVGRKVGQVEAGQKPTEWSELDKLHLNSAILVAKKEWGVNSYTARWLESLRDNYKKCNCRWKPSEEQINALERAIIKMHTPNDIGILAELRDNLKKL